MEGKKISLETILENSPESIEVPEYGIVKVRVPTTKEKLDAKKEAMKIAEGLSESDIAMETARILATKMLVEPQISLEDYLKCNDSTASVILDTVHMWYNLKIKAINAKRQEQMKSFLEQMRE